MVVGLATTLTWQIVSAADDQVSERPIAPLNVAAPVITDGATTTTTQPSTTTSTLEPTTSPTSSPGTTAPTSTTSSSTPATTTVAWQTRSVQTTGGTVNLRYRPGEVTYQSATPAPGFQVEVEKAGPPEVRVEFESESTKVEVEASWEDGGLDVRVSNEDEGDDDD